MANFEAAPVLPPPAVTALRNEPDSQATPKDRMERSVSQDIREERADLKEAAEHSQNVILDLSLDGKIRWVSPSWQNVIGTSPDEVQGKPIADLLVDNKTVFSEAVESIQRDDSRSQIVRFTLPLGPLAAIRRRSERSKGEDQVDQIEQPVDERMYEAQGIMVYDRTSGGGSHVSYLTNIFGCLCIDDSTFQTMWMIRPYIVREITIDLPEVLVKSLGVGAEVLAQYLTKLAEAGVEDPANRPPPLPILCRICERQITPWWFEKHTELCLQEHKAEMEVQMSHESLTDHRNAIVRVLDALEAHSRQPRPTTSGELAPPPPPLPEYKGLPIGPLSSPSSRPPSGRSSPVPPPSRSRDRSTSSLSHSRARLFAVRRPVARIVELVLDLCDTALEINTPALKDTRGLSNGEFRTQSPQSENRISQVLQWQSPTSSTMEQEQGLSALCDDTSKFARAKVDAVFRHRRILEYSERIRVEFEVLVQECITTAMEKAARIAAGELTDSSDDTGRTPQERSEDFPEESGQEDSQEQMLDEGNIHRDSFEPSSAMATALRNASDPPPSSHPDRRTSSTTTSTRSSSPRGSQTPRSHAGTTTFPPLGKRGSIAFESDTGAESDSSQLSSAISASRRAESPSSELSLSRVASSRERKRRSLILPSVMSSRGHSPARGMPPPSSPLRLARNRLPSGESSHSPVTSPILSTSEFSSPVITALQHHRRQSSATSSEVLRPPMSPKLLPVSSTPQPRPNPPSIKDFEIIKPISKGAFGSVYLSKKKSTGDYYAIKVLKKSDMIAKNQITNVKAERAIMMWQGESDFVAKLYWTFSSKDYLYLVMEYLNGGDCASLVKVLGGLPEDWSKKYMAEVVLGVEHLHSRGIVHRDLKPDNLLIDQKGHLKLTDFGLSRMGVIGRQKRATDGKSDEPPVPDLLKQGPFHRAVSVGSSRSTSFDLQGGGSPSQTPSLTPALMGDYAQPSYFSLTRETSRTNSGRSDSETSESLQAMFRKFSLVDDAPMPQSRSPIEEGTGSDDANSQDLYALYPTTSHASTVKTGTPPTASSMLPPNLALFDPKDSSRKFVGTPDYLAPETINGIGQDEVSDWWSLGCILFEFLYGYPPFHGDSPDIVFENILSRKIDWPPEDACRVSPEARDLMEQLLCMDPAKRLGANAEEKYESGGDEIRHHPWFSDINWLTLREDEASFVPAPENPEDTEYFDSRGATLQNFASEFDDQGNSSAGTPSADYPDRPHDALSRIRSHVNSIKRSLMPLHIPPHVRDGRNRRLSEPMASDDFGNFSFKNLPVLEKANKDVIQKLRAEAMQAQSKPMSALASPVVSSSNPSLESSPVLNIPLKRTMSTTRAPNRPSSPLTFGNQQNSSPSRPSQPSSPLLVQFSAGQERRKTSSGSSSLSQLSSSSLQPGSFFDPSRAAANLKASSNTSSPIKLAKSPGAPTKSHERSLSSTRSSSTLGKIASPRARSHTISSQEGDELLHGMMPKENKRRSQALDVSPSSSDNEDSRSSKALLRVQRRRQSSRRLSQIFPDGPIFRPLDVLVCEDHPVSKLVMEKLLEKLRCRTITAQTGPEAVKYAMSEVKFDIILMEYKLAHINGADVARMVKDTKNENSHTPIVCVTGYLKELPPSHHFDDLMDKPPTVAKLTEVLGKFCQWKPPPPNWTPTMPFSSLRQDSVKSDGSPISVSSSYGVAIPSSSYRGSSREDSISSSWYGDAENRMEDMSMMHGKQLSADWRDHDLVQAFDGLGITGDTSEESELKPTSQMAFRGMIPLRHEESAPPILEHTTGPMKRVSSERFATRRRSQERMRRESAESGDDEDEELGHLQIRTRSPRNRPRGSSKLGTEMMRTNSRGSVISVEEISTEDKITKSPPPTISENRKVEDETEKKTGPATEANHGGLTPPEIFPQQPGEHVEEVEMEPAEVTTPKPIPGLSETASPDPDPTPRPSIACAKLDLESPSSTF